MYCGQTFSFALVNVECCVEMFEVRTVMIEIYERYFAVQLGTRLKSKMWSSYKIKLTRYK